MLFVSFPGAATPAGPYRGLLDGAAAVLAAAEPETKIALSRAVADGWRGGGLAIGTTEPPPRPARPPRPRLLPPRDMPKRRNFGSPAGRVALLHALAHIELNAIDLAWDFIARFGVARFGGAGWPRGFFDDWVTVAAEEAEHFSLLSARLASLGASYGDLPAHDGLWEAAAATSRDPLARLAIVPLVLEARGLDVTPEMIARLRRAGDSESAALLDRIYHDEIGHVAAGRRWFDLLCERQAREPLATFHELVRRYFTGVLKPPFNRPAREAAGFAAAWYEGLVCADARC
ncbi:MAG: ferritin-like domain-containing protein [Alphaproteobacteria bacterium]